MVIAVSIGWAVLAIGAAWVVVTAVLAAGEARDLRQDAAQLKTQLAAGDFDPARATAQRIESRAD
ncbi:MAG: hypothetical protein LBQ06_05220, partial [Frankiaceae bacterium]|nr:hypothetical protein [Frankiaceae bacterium]